MNRVAIEAVAYQMAPHCVTTSALEEQILETMTRLDIEPGYIEKMCGIRERRFWDPGVRPSTAATWAANRVLEQAAISPHQVGCLINTSVSRDYLEPSVACFVHRNLGLRPDCINFDVSNACLGFLDGINTVKMMIAAGQLDYGLVVNAESAREHVEHTLELLRRPGVDHETFHSHLPTLTVGSGAAAMLLCRADLSRSGHILNGSVNLSATQYNHLCLGSWNQMITKGADMVPAAVALIRQAWRMAATKIRNWHDELIDHYIPHQIGLRQLTIFNRALGISDAKVRHTIQWFGNMGPATMPITLALADEQGQLRRGDHVVFLGVGSGLNCTMMSMTW
ncbi:MAG: 3-oxoacyl-ACP synthase III [Candidatus Competibacterales bacterium]